MKKTTARPSKYSHAAYGRRCWWPWLRITAAIETDRQRDITVVGICVPHKHTHTFTSTHYKHTVLSSLSIQALQRAGHRAERSQCVAAVASEMSAGHSCLIQPVCLSCDVYLNNKLQSCCRGASKHQTAYKQRWALLGQCCSFYIAIRQTMGVGQKML